MTGFCATGSATTGGGVACLDTGISATRMVGRRSAVREGGAAGASSPSGLRSAGRRVLASSTLMPAIPRRGIRESPRRGDKSMAGRNPAWDDPASQNPNGAGGGGATGAAGATALAAISGGASTGAGGATTGGNSTAGCTTEDETTGAITGSTTAVGFGGGSNLWRRDLDRGGNHRLGRRNWLRRRCFFHNRSRFGFRTAGGRGRRRQGRHARRNRRTVERLVSITGAAEAAGLRVAPPSRNAFSLLTSSSSKLASAEPLPVIPAFVQRSTSSLLSIFRSFANA